MAACENSSAKMAIGVPFRDLKPPLSEDCLAILESKGMSRTTPVQAATIPLFCSNKDVAVEAVTGSGKTLAFVLPIVEMLRRIDPPLKPHQVGAIVISPTRELASQIASVSAEFVSTVPHLRQLLLVGGNPVKADCDSLSTHGANVLICTPGRLDDILERSSSIDIRTLEVLILDEADRLLELGFSAQLSSIMSKLPKQRRTGLFSATQTQAVKELALAGMRNPVRVEVQVRHFPSSDPPPPPHHHHPHSENSDGSPSGALSKLNGEGKLQGTRSKIPIGLNIQYMICEYEEKPSQLLSLLSANTQSKIILFVLTCACVDYWNLVLSRLSPLKNVNIIPLHGKLNQITRDSSLKRFSSLSHGILICTDIAARGLDLPDVNWIVQMDPPQDPKAFVHRAGRTARMGREGNAIVFLLPKEDAYVEYLQLQGIPMKEMKKDETLQPITDEIRKEAMKDRDVFEKGLKAYVSFVRGYKEHHCNYIFNWKELEFGRLGMSFGLLYLPSMPEIRRKPKMALDFIPVPDLDPTKIKFKDKRREKQRQTNIKAKRAAEGSIADSNKEKRKKEMTTDLKKKQNSKKKNSSTNGDTEDLELEEDEDDLEDDYRALKKLKKGIITEEEFDQVVGLTSDSADMHGEDGNQDARNVNIQEEGHASNHSGEIHDQKEKKQEVTPSKLLKSRAKQKKMTKKNKWKIRKTGIK